MAMLDLFNNSKHVKEQPQQVNFQKDTFEVGFKSFMLQGVSQFTKAALNFFDKDNKNKYTEVKKYK